MPALERVVATPKVHDMQCHYYDIMSRVITLHNVTLILLTFFSPGKLLQSTIWSHLFLF